MSDTIPPPPPEFPPTEGVPGAPPPGAPTAPTEPTEPAGRKRSPLLIGGIVALVVIVVAGVAVFALRPKGGGTYTANGVTFSYPSSWDHGPTTFVAQRGTSLWSETFAPTDGPDSVIVTEYTLTNDISGVPAAEAQRQLTDLVRGLAQQAGGDITSEAAPTSVGTLDGYVVRFSAQVNGTPVDVELTMLFHGTAQYNINCQASDAMASEIATGCDQVKGTFALTGESPAP